MEGGREEQRWNGPVDRVTQQGTMPPPGPLAEHGDTDPCGWADIDTRELATARDTGPHHWAVPPHISERRGKHRHNGPDTWGKAVTGPTGLCRRTTTHVSGRRLRHRHKGPDVGRRSSAGQYCCPAASPGRRSCRLDPRSAHGVTTQHRADGHPRTLFPYPRRGSGARAVVPAKLRSPYSRAVEPYPFY